MARYRPISPEQAWRSTRSAQLNMAERYGEFYLLTSPFSNAIGCYRIVERIAAAEIGLSLDQFLDMLNRLQNRGIAVFENGYILVRTWFLHNTWESALQGNVAKAAIRDVAELPAKMRENWISACIEAGVPEEIIEKFIPEPLPSPSQGATNPLNNKNNNIEQLTRTGTTTTQDKESKVVRGGSRNEIALHLLPIAEIHRAFIESCVQDLSPEDAQKIADEVSGALEAAQNGKREPIHGMHGWLPTLVDRLRHGTFIPQCGPAIAARRAAAAQAQQREVESTLSKAIELKRQEQEQTETLKILQTLSPADLDVFSVIAEKHVPIREMRPKIKEAISNRELPTGLGGAAVLAAAKEWRFKMEMKQ